VLSFRIQGSDIGGSCRTKNGRKKEERRKAKDERRKKKQETRKKMLVRNEQENGLLYR
jgi:hypothetical protein